MRNALSRLAIVLALAATLAPVPSRAGTAPSTMMANVYRFSEAGAVLEVCFTSPAFARLARDRAEGMRALGERLTRLVKAIGRYYGDASVFPSYEATRSRLAAESRLRLHVKNHYDYCGPRLAAEMDRYLAENEQLLGSYFSQDPPKGPHKRPPEPGPPKK